MNTLQTCGGCEWFDAGDRPWNGRCYESPPSITRLGPQYNEEWISVRPEVDAGDKACSRYKAVHGMKLLIDGDVELYQAASAVENKYQWPDCEPTYVGNLAEAKHRIIQRLDHFRRKFPGRDLEFILSDKVTWRHRENPDYKANRKDRRKPTDFSELRAWAENLGTSVIWRDLEADDVMGILGTTPGIDAIVVTVDKDLMGVPCRLFNPAKSKRPKRITKGRADYYHMFQSLTGDPVDNYPGVPGIGPKRAAGILKPFRSPRTRWAAVVKAYESKGLTFDDALLNARMARICRHGDYDFDKGEMTWTPPCL